MSGNNGYKNEFDPEDDGKDIEFTEQDYARSDDQGREEAVVLLRAGNAIKGGGKLDHDHRRMFYRWANRELADGRVRREAAAAAEKATLAAEEKADREKAALDAKRRRHRERFERSMRESDERWARLDEQTRQENAAWEAGRADREAAAARPVPVTAPPTPARRDAPPSPTTITTSNAASARPATTPVTTTTLPAAAGPTSTATPGPARPFASPSSSRPALAATRPRETQPQPRHVEPERWVATSARPARSPPNAASPPAAPCPTPPRATPPSRSAPTPTAVHPRRASASPPTAALTGADLAAWRSTRGLTQRPAAALLGVAPSTVAKAELLPGKVLGEQLQVALAAALAR